MGRSFSRLQKKNYSYGLTHQLYPGGLVTPPGAQPIKTAVVAKKEEVICPGCQKPLSQYDIDVGRRRHLDCY